jgi:hypothetical protein
MRVRVVPYHCGLSNVAGHPIRVSPSVLFTIVFVMKFNFFQHELGGSLMSNNEFRRPVSVDSAPRGSQCEWCGKPAEQQLTAIGGSYHNDSGLFCRECGEKFAQAVANSVTAVPPVPTRFTTY